MVDDLGRRVAVPAEPRRIVSLAPALTEILFALGAGDRLVGTAEFSNFPPEAAKVPVVGALAGDLERILARRPDLVVATTEGNDRRVVESLERLGTPVWVADAKDLSGVILSIERLGAAVGRGEEGRRIAREMRRRVAAVEALPAPRPAPRVAWVVWPDPLVVAGAGSFLDDLVRRGGGMNAFGDVDRPWPTVGREELAARRPDVVLYPDSPETRGSFEAAFAGPLARVLPAGVRIVPVAGDRAQRPGPRLVEALEEIARALRPPPAGAAR